MTEQYRVYDRQTLAYICGGVMRDFVVDMDYLSSNASRIMLTDTTTAGKGDIVVGIQGLERLFIGVISAVDNTKKEIKFLHLKHLFNDNILNVFKWTASQSYIFEAGAILELLLRLAFVDTVDTRRHLPLTFERRGVANGAVWHDDGDTINLGDFINFCFEHHNVYLDFDIDFDLNRLIVRIIKNTTTGKLVKDNIALSEPEFDLNELPTHNVAQVFHRDTGVIQGTFYLLSNNTITTNANHAQRLFPVQSRFLRFDPSRDYTPLQLATSELQGGVYNHGIVIKLSKTQRLVPPFQFNFGDEVDIIYKGRSYKTIFTGHRYSAHDPFIKCYFGRNRIDFTDRLKIFMDKRYRRANN